MNVTAIIAAGGSSSRMNGTNKLLKEVGGKALLVRTTEAFLNVAQIDQIIIVASKDNIESYKQILDEAECLDKVNIIEGGKNRRESVYNGLIEADKETRIVLIHDAARPLVTEKLITDCIKVSERHGACCAAIPLSDTLKEVGDKGFVKKTINRENLYRIQTPQAFHYKDILKLHKRAAYRGLKVTDDAQIAEYFGYHVYIVDSDESNIKVTTPVDLVIANAILSAGNNTSTEDTLTTAEHGERFAGSSGKTNITDI